ncbi:hypothetical protein PI125_g10250 [Phytophthora idaei]|nr:hypothetical protein PI125_g10250 [Phytophthora idaei]
MILVEEPPRPGLSLLMMSTTVMRMDLVYHQLTVHREQLSIGAGKDEQTL